MYLDDGIKTKCFGCEACFQICAKGAIKMREDEEGFRYPVIDREKCINCGLCQTVCPYENVPQKHTDGKFVFGGYNLNPSTRFESTSGGAFSAIVDAFCDENYVIFGAEASGLSVFHSYITDKRDIGKFRKSKYSQSVIGQSFIHVAGFLKEGKKVLFSGTPCQNAGLVSYLKVNNVDRENLLLVEVVCEGVPSPLYVRKMDDAVDKKYGSRIKVLDYRYTGKGIVSKGKWDFEEMKVELVNKSKVLVKDRWFNPFWSIWLQHLMSRPSCYKCSFTTKDRVADITLGDLWGVHLFCPDLYGKNGGASLVVCNSEKGIKVFQKAQTYMYGHELKFEDALKYQGPMRKCISENPQRKDFMADLQSEIEYKVLVKKWAKRPSVKLLFQKYVWGNRQKVFFWNLSRRLQSNNCKK